MMTFADQTKHESHKTSAPHAAWQGWLMLMPNLVGFVLFLFIPLLLSLYLSFTSGGTSQSPGFVGLNNYAELFSIELRWKDDVQADDQSALSSGYTPLGSIVVSDRALVVGAKDALFWISLRNTLVLCLLLIPLSVLPALELALLLNSKLAGVKIFRTIYFLPAVVAMVGTALIWRELYNPIFGLINGLITQINGFIGISDPEIQWLSGSSVMLFSTAILIAWQTVGFNTILFLAGLQRIPDTLYEAAEIDGAGRWALFRRITLPMLRPITLLVTITTLVTGLQVFDQPYTMFTTEPMPENVTILTTYLYQRGFLAGESGYASAIGCVLGLIIFAIALIHLRVRRSNAFGMTLPFNPRYDDLAEQDAIGRNAVVDGWMPRLVVYTVLTGVALITLFPFLYMLSTSLKDSNDVFHFPPRLLPYTTRTVEYDGRTVPVYVLSVDGVEREMIPTGNRALTSRGFEDEFIDPVDPKITTFVAVQTATLAEFVQFRFDNYPTVLDLGLGRALLNTIFVSVCVVVGQLITSIFGGYAFSRMRFRGRDTLFLIYLGATMIPLVVFIIPLHRLMVLMGWENSLASLIVPWMFSAYGTFLMRQFFLTIPREIEETAMLDGAGRLRILWRIFVPLSRPALATLALFSFISAWNSFLWPLVMIGEAHEANHVLTLALIHLRNIVADQPNVVLAGVAIAITPPIIVFIVAQKYFFEGVAQSSMKG